MNIRKTWYLIFAISLSLLVSLVATYSQPDKVLSAPISDDTFYEGIVTMPTRIPILIVTPTFGPIPTIPITSTVQSGQIIFYVDSSTSSVSETLSIMPSLTPLRGANSERSIAYAFSMEDFAALSPEELAALPDNIEFIEWYAQRLPEAIDYPPRPPADNLFINTARLITLDAKDTKTLDAIIGILEEHQETYNIYFERTTLLNKREQIYWYTSTEKETAYIATIIYLSTKAQNERMPLLINAPWEIDGGPWEIDGGPWEIDGGPWMNLFANHNNGMIEPATCGNKGYLAPWKQWALTDLVTSTHGIGLFNEMGVHKGCTMGWDGEGVTIFILDSWPTTSTVTITTTTEITLAPDFPVTVHKRPLTPRNPPPPCNDESLQTIAESGQLTPTITITNRVPDKTAEHGPFSANLIYTVAPKTNVELYRVLDCDGAGSIEDLRKALAEIDNRIQTENLGTVIINLSLTARLFDFDITGGTPNLSHYEPKEYGNSYKTLQEMLDELEKNGAVIVAAAGNDSHKATAEQWQELEDMYPNDENSLTANWQAIAFEDDRYIINMPARFPNVVDVVSMAADGTKSCFTNAANFTHNGTALTPTYAPGGNGGMSPIRYIITVYGQIREGKYRIPSIEEVRDRKLVCGPPLMITDTITVPLNAYAYNVNPSITSMLSDGTLAYWEGSSFSTALVSGLSALIVDACPKATSAEVRNILANANNGTTITWEAILSNLCPNSTITFHGEDENGQEKTCPIALNEPFSQGDGVYKLTDTDFDGCKTDMTGTVKIENIPAGVIIDIFDDINCENTGSNHTQITTFNHIETNTMNPFNTNYEDIDIHITSAMTIELDNVISCVQFTRFGQTAINQQSARLWERNWVTINSTSNFYTPIPLSPTPLLDEGNEGDQIWTNKQALLAKLQGLILPHNSEAANLRWELQQLVTASPTSAIYGTYYNLRYTEAMRALATTLQSEVNSELSTAWNAVE